MHVHKKNTLIISLVSAIIFYYLSGILFNPFILWTALPLYVGYYYINGAVRADSVKKVYAAYGFLFVSILISILYHLTWYLDWQGTKTSSSSSAVIFFIFPLYAVLLGFVGYGIGHLVGLFKERKNQ